MYSDIVKYKATGHLRIWEKETGKVLLDHHNAIHPENMSLAIAQSLSHGKGFIREMVFGNGGVRVNASNEFLYSAPQTIGRMASLYNERNNQKDNQNKLRQKIYNELSFKPQINEKSEYISNSKMNPYRIIFCFSD